MRKLLRKLMSKFTDFLFIAKVPKLCEMSHLKFIGLSQIFLAIAFGAYSAFFEEGGLSSDTMPALLFLIGIATAHLGVLSEHVMTLKLEKKDDNHDIRD